MEREDSLPHLQVPVACPYPEPDQSSPWPPSHFLNIHLKMVLPSMPVSSMWSLSLKFLNQNPVFKNSDSEIAVYYFFTFICD